MKQITLFFAVISVFSMNSQTNIQDGNHCFDSSDYACAIIKYEDAFKNSSGKDKQFAEIKLTRAKWCAKHIKIANQLFAAKNYTAAKKEFQMVIDSNPKDYKALSQIIKCYEAPNQQKLRKATAADLTDIWNDKYGVNPQRRKNLISAGIDADDAQKRISAGENKPKEQEKPITKLRVSKSTVNFTSYGEVSEQITVYSNMDTYSVPLAYVPSWCTIKTYNDYFTVTAITNSKYTSRQDWFKVLAGDKEVRINIMQSAKEVEKEVSFSVIEEVPVFPGCKGDNVKLKKCMSEKIKKHVSRKFNVDLAQDLGLSSGRKRISVQFKIDKTGNITNVQARAPHPRLQKEAIRIIKLLPKMKPGRQRNKPVTVKYNLPIVFNVEN